jgi:hypothetical protein
MNAAMSLVNGRHSINLGYQEELLYDDRMNITKYQFLHYR